jgi:hypothetical protein
VKTACHRKVRLILERKEYAVRELKFDRQQNL